VSAVRVNRQSQSPESASRISRPSRLPNLLNWLDLPVESTAQVCSKTQLSDVVVRANRPTQTPMSISRVDRRNPSAESTVESVSQVSRPSRSSKIPNQLFESVVGDARLRQPSESALRVICRSQPSESVVWVRRPSPPSESVIRVSCSVQTTGANDTQQSARTANYQTSQAQTTQAWQAPPYCLS
jgi:hypothetical protein